MSAALKEPDCGHGFTSWQNCGRCCQNRAYALIDVERECDAALREVAELRRRVRLIRATFYRAKTVAKYGTTDTDALGTLVRLLDLRRPLPKGRRP